MSLEVTSRSVNEKATAVYKATLEDENGATVPATSLATLVLTLWNKYDGAIINSRSAQNVLNANNVTVDSDGLLTWNIQSADNIIMGTGEADQESEQHIAEFVWTWPSGTPTKRGSYRIIIEVVHSSKAPA